MGLEQNKTRHEKADAATGLKAPQSTEKIHRLALEGVRDRLPMAADDTRGAVLLMPQLLRDHRGPRDDQRPTRLPRRRLGWFLREVRRRWQTAGRMPLRLLNERASDEWRSARCWLKWTRAARKADIRLRRRLGRQADCVRSGMQPTAQQGTRNRRSVERLRQHMIEAGSEVAALVRRAGVARGGDHGKALKAHGPDLRCRRVPVHSVHDDVHDDRVRARQLSVPHTLHVRDCTAAVVKRDRRAAKPAQIPRVDAADSALVINHEDGEAEKREVFLTAGATGARGAA
jgi:hypothetical protein